MALVQTKTATSTFASTVAAMTSNPVTGNLILVVIGMGSNSLNNVSGVTDSRGNTYTRAFAGINTGGICGLEVWYAKNITGGAANSVTVAYSNPTNCSVVVREYSGLNTTAPLDGVSTSASAASTNPVSNSITTTANGDLIIGAFGFNGTVAATAGSGFANLQSIANSSQATTEDLTQSTAGSITAGVTAGSSQWVAAVLAFKAGGSALSKTQTAVASIANTKTKTQSAVARIATNPTKTQSSVARIQKVVTKTQPAIARIAVQRTLTQPAIARISQSFTKTQPAVSRITSVVNKTQSATSRIVTVVTKTQPAAARISQSLTKTQPAIARISNSRTKTQTAIARVATRPTKTQGAVAHITSVVTKTQPAVAKIASTVNKTQSAIASLTQTPNMISPILGRCSTINATTVGYAHMSASYTFAPAAAETTVSQIVPTDGIIQNFAAFVATAPGLGTSLTFDVMKNGIATGISVTIADTAIRGVDTVNTTTITQGDTLSVRITPTNTPATGSGSFFAEFSGRSQILFTATNTALNGNTVAAYASMEGGVQQAASTDMGSIMPTAGTISAGTLHVTNVAGASKSWTLTLVKNGTDTALTTTVSGAAQLTNSDNTNTVSVVAGDICYWRIDPVSTPANTRIKIGYVFTPTVYGESVHFGNSNTNMASATAVNYSGVGGGALTTTSAPTNRTNEFDTTFDFKKLYASVDTAPGVGKRWDVAIRTDTTATAVGFSISDTATSGNDTTNTATPGQPSLMGISLTGSGTPGLTPYQWSYVTYRAPAFPPLSATQTAKARIANNRTSTQSATARIAQVPTKTQTATARIANVKTKTQTAIARIAKIVTKTQTSIARIANSSTKTQTAIARVANSKTKTQGAIARVSTSPVKTQPAVARIVNVRTKTQSSVASIIQANTKTQPAIARIANSFTKTQGAIARISKTPTKTQSAIARIVTIRIKTQSAIASVIQTFVGIKTQPAKARISRNVTKTQSATATIIQTALFKGSLGAVVDTGATGRIVSDRTNVADVAGGDTIRSVESATNQGSSASKSTGATVSSNTNQVEID